MNLIKGYFYNNLINKRKDTEELKNCMEETVFKLLDSNTSPKHPGILLGKIQSGKTRAFIGVIALAFDNGYDISIILTKGTKALAKQTGLRLSNDYKEFIEDDKLKVFDILNLPNNLAKWELNQKLVIVVKKEINNMKKIINNLVNIYPNLSQKKILIVDDEADFASVSFRKIDEAIEVGKISSQIDELRRLTSDTDYLQVTATPYSLYLQPDNEEIKDSEFFPKRPSFTVLVPIHSSYIGGDFYFFENEEISKYIYEEVPLNERDALKKMDGRKFKIDEVLDTNHIEKLRKALMNFIVGANIRREQQLKDGEKQQKYAFVAHSEISKDSHNWQKNVVEKLVDEFCKIANDNKSKLDNIILDSYNDISRSALLIDSNIPSFDFIKNKVYESLIGGEIMITVVNSEKEVEELLDENGQLKLRTPMNIFIGGQILDRGITIQNLIGFYYGRNPKKFQQDTVLQHSRMYGARSFKDLSVTRFYTTYDIYNVMKTIHDFDTALRSAFERGDNKNGIYFIRKDISGKIAPCSPSKLLLSSLTSLKPYKRLLPIGFQTGFKTNILKDVKYIDDIINKIIEGKDVNNPIIVDLDIITNILDVINNTFIYDNQSYKWDIKSFKASLEHLSLNSCDEEKRGKVLLLIRKDRNLKRVKEDGGFSDSPDTPKTEGLIAKENAIDIPIIMLFRQNGKEEDGWRGSPFWWPVLVAPQNTQTTIFAGETI